MLLVLLKCKHKKYGGPSAKKLAPNLRRTDEMEGDAVR